MPRRSAHSAAWVRSTTPMRLKTEVRCAFTVRSLDPEPARDLLVGEPRADQPQHLELSRGSGRACGRPACRAPSSSRAARGCSGDSPRLTARTPVDDVLGLGVLEQVADGTGVQRGDDPLGVRERRQHQHVRAAVGDDLPGRRDPVDARASAGP